MVEDALMNHVQVSVNHHRLRNLGITDLPRYKTKPESWQLWAKDALDVSAKVASLEEIVESRPTYDLRAERELSVLKRLKERLNYFSHSGLTNWVYEPTEERIVFKPVWANTMAEHRLFRHAKTKVLAMSGTVNALQWSEYLGLRVTDVERLRLRSGFPRERRPIYYWPVTDMTAKSFGTAWPDALVAIDRVLSDYPDRRGLIQSVSYQLARYIMQHSRHRERLIGHDSQDRDEALRMFLSQEGSL